jgi:transcriptional regulator with XRE-family HTH domain
MLRRWRQICGWTQYTAKHWAEEANLGTGSRSGLSELERGLTRHPRAGVFLDLAEMNLRIHQRDFSGVRSRELMDRLQTSRAILDAAGEPWGPSEFWSCHAGLLAPPEWLGAPSLSPAPVLTPEQAADLSAAWARQARELVQLASGSASDLLRATNAAPVRVRERWGLVLLGLSSYSPEELESHWDAEASEWAPSQWLNDWAATLSPAGGGGGNSESRTLTL